MNFFTQYYLVREIPIAAYKLFSSLYNIPLCDYHNLPIDSSINNHLNGAATNLLEHV